MSIAELILIGLSLAMDAFAVSVGKGMAVGRPSWRQILSVALWFGGFQALMPFLGWALGGVFAASIQAVDHWIAFILLALIGGNMIREAIRETKEDKAEGVAASGHDADFGVRTMFVLAVATSIDALAVGVDFALLSVHIWAAISIIGVVTALTSAIGLVFGGILGERFKTGAQIAGGAVLILIGIKIVVENLFFG